MDPALQVFLLDPLAVGHLAGHALHRILDPPDGRIVLVGQGGLAGPQSSVKVGSLGGQLFGQPVFHLLPGVVIGAAAAQQQHHQQDIAHHEQQAEYNAHFHHIPFLVNPILRKTGSLWC